MKQCEAQRGTVRLASNFFQTRFSYNIVEVKCHRRTLLAVQIEFENSGVTADSLTILSPPYDAHK